MQDHCCLPYELFIFFYFCLYTYFAYVNFIIFQKHFCFPFSFIKPSPWILFSQCSTSWRPVRPHLILLHLLICSDLLNFFYAFILLILPSFVYFYILHLYSSFSILYLLVIAICKKCFKDIFSNYAICKFSKRFLSQKMYFW